MKTTHYSPKRKSLFDKKVIMQLNKNILQSVIGGKLPDEQENTKVANKLGLLLVIFLLVQFFIVLMLVLKAFEK